MTTYNQLILLFQEIANKHYQIKSFGHGQISEIEGEKASEENYPKLWVTPTETINKEHTVERTFDVLVFDLVQKDKSNRDEVLSDTEQILTDVIKTIKNNSVAYELTNEPSATPFEENFGDDVTGWSASVSIETDLVEGMCDIPTDLVVSITGSGNCAGGDCGGGLKCSDLPLCPTVIAIEAELLDHEGRIEALEAGGGGGGNQNLASVLGYGNTTNGFPIIISNGDYIASEGITSVLSLSDSQAQISFGDIQNGNLTINNTKSNLKHDSLIELEAVSVTKNGVEIATLNDIIGYTASNGLTQSGSDIKLGGDLTGNTSIDGAFNLNLGTVTTLAGLYAYAGADSVTDYTKLYLDGSQAALTTNAPSGEFNVILVEKGLGVKLVASNTGGTESNAMLLTNSPITLTNNNTNNTIVVTDNISSKGIVYATDYSSNFTPESLVSKRYVDTALSGYATQAWVTSQGYITNVVTALGFTPENIINKATDFSTINNTKYPTTQATENRYALKQNGLTSGGVIIIGDFDAGGTNNDVQISAATWDYNFTTYQTLTDTYFYNIALSSAGLQRYVGFYGTTSNTIVKVEGTESEYATLPTQPANTVLIGYILVTDSAADSGPDLSAYLQVAPRTLSVASSATPTLNTNDYDVLNITALATNITSMTSGLSGSPANFQRLIMRIKDNGTSRTITWGTGFVAMGATLPLSTTISKTWTLGFLYNSATAKWGCVAAVQEA